MAKRNVEIERKVSKRTFINLLDRIKEGLETGAPARIMVKGNRVSIPANSKLSVEFEVDEDEAELELQFSWKVREGKAKQK